MSYFSAWFDEEWMISRLILTSLFSEELNGRLAWSSIDWQRLVLVMRAHSWLLSETTNDYFVDLVFNLIYLNLRALIQCFQWIFPSWSQLLYHFLFCSKAFLFRWMCLFHIVRKCLTKQGSEQRKSPLSCSIVVHFSGYVFVCRCCFTQACRLVLQKKREVKIGREIIHSSSSKARK